MTDQERVLVALEQVENLILSIRRQKVMLDADLAALYDVRTAELTRVVKRHLDRFPPDFAFELTAEEFVNSEVPIWYLKIVGRRRFTPLSLGRAMHSSVCLASGANS